MFLLKVGDIVKLNREAKDFIGDKLFNAVSNTEFKITDIRTDNSCENNDKTCCCDKYITIKDSNLCFVDVLQSELSIVTIKEAV